MPEWLILTIKIAVGPIVGAVIGFFTNWLAVKMLFRPYREKHLGKWRIPFTPGIIPKRKQALGRALGKAVGTQLITPTDIERLFSAEDIADRIAAVATDALFPDDGRTPRDLLDRVQAGAADKAVLTASELLADKLVDALEKADLPALLSSHSAEVLSALGGVGSVLGAIGGKKLAAKIADAVGEKLQNTIADRGRELILPVVQRELEDLLSAPVRDTAIGFGLTREKVGLAVREGYTRFVVPKIAEFVAHFDIAGVVEKKVDEMDMAELERLFMSVMKRELGAIVNLGALLGGIVGIINSLIMLFL